MQIKAIENSLDKANYFIAFALLFVTIHGGFRLKIFQEFCILLLYGIEIEIVQFFIPNREFSILDIFADVIGLFAGIFCVKILQKYTFLGFKF